MKKEAGLRPTKKRDANLDLLRIVSMMLIVFLHSIDHSGVLEQAEYSSAAMRFYVQLTFALTKVCVNCYVMLSGYYLVQSRFRLKKLVTLWMEVVFYAVFLKLSFMITGKDGFSILSLASCFAPVLTGRYWFITIYVGLYLVSPFLNLMIRAMNKRQHTALNLCLFGLFSLWSSLHPSIAGMNSGGGWGLAWFVVLYFLAAWLRLYYKPDHKPAKWFVIYLLLPLIMAVAKCLRGGGIIGDVVRVCATNWFKYDSVPVYIMTLSLFAGFLNIRISSDSWAKRISRIAPLTLGVYLIHAHANVDPWLWETMALPEKMDSLLFVPAQIGAVLLIFCACVAIDWLRKMTVGRLEQGTWIDRCCGYTEKWTKEKLLKKDC